MKTLYLQLLLPLLFTITHADGQSTNTTFQTFEYQSFTLHLTAADSSFRPTLSAIFTRGTKQVESFFGKSYPNKFDIWIFPNRAALDRQWQQDWGDTTFHSECWMVASGVAKRLDVLSPNAWKTEACEHDTRDTAALYKLLAHELVHVFHGQFCRSHDFTGMDAVGWWVEGLAVLASGQLDPERLTRVRTLEQSGKAPAQLKDFWSGANRYWLAGSVVAALDKQLNRKTLLQLLPLSTEAELYEVLKMNEAEVLVNWRTFLKE